MNLKSVRIGSFVFFSLTIFVVIYYSNVLQASFTRGLHTYSGHSGNWSDVAIDSTGQPWVTESGDGVCVLKRFENSSWTTYPEKCGLPYFDTNGDLWIAGSGLLKYDGKDWQEFTTKNSGLPSDHVQELVFDHRGRMWIIYRDETWNTSQKTYEYSPGVTVFDNTGWVTYDAANSGLPTNKVNTVAFDADNHAWVGTDEGLSIFDGQQWVTYTPQNSGLTSMDVRSIAFDQENRGWIGGTGGINVFDGTHWVYLSPDEMGFRKSAGVIGYDVRIDQMGRAWVWEYWNELRIFDHGVWSGISENIIPSEINSILPDNQGNVWVSIVGGELIKLEKDYRFPSNLEYHFVKNYQVILFILGGLILLTLLGNVVGTVMLMAGIGLGWAWYLLTPEYYRSHITGFYIIGYLVCGFIIFTSVELMVWMTGRGSKGSRVPLIASAIVLPFAFSFHGMNIGYTIGSNYTDVPMFEALIGIIIGFGIGAVFSALIIFIAARERTQPKGIPFPQGEET